MLKLMNGNLILDICKKERYLKYLPQQKRFVEVKKYMANAILGSDNDTVYHILGTPYTFPNKIQSVVPQAISEEEFEKVQATNYLLKSQQDNVDLKKEIDLLKDLVAQQSLLIQQLLEKIP